MKHVLFVDDEPALLEGLRDALRPRRREWRMHFVPSGAEALEALESRPCDVLVSDLQMPGMDGAELLSTVADRHPGTIRIVLSGAASESTVARAAAVAHRLMAKPCETADLVRVVERACALHETAERVALRRAVAGASELPSAPRLYAALTALLADDDASIADAASIAAQDVALSAKILQVANSPVFGSRRPVTSVRDATSLVGVTTLRVLALSAGTLIALGDRRVPPIPGFSVDALQRRSLQVATVAQLVWGRRRGADDAFSAGLLLDVGVLVLATCEHAHLAALVAAATAEGQPIEAVERAHGDVTHADIGAHLLALWGLPPTVIDAVAHHADPCAIPSPSFDIAAAAHLADAIVDTLRPDPLLGNGGLAALSDPYLDALGVRDRLDGWVHETAALLGWNDGGEEAATATA